MEMFGRLEASTASVFENRYILSSVLQSGKAPGLDGFPVECLKKGCMAMLECLVRLLNVSFHLWVVPTTGVVVPLYKGKGDKC